MGCESSTTSQESTRETGVGGGPTPARLVRHLTRCPPLWTTSCAAVGAVGRGPRAVDGFQRAGCAGLRGYSTRVEKRMSRAGAPTSVSRVQPSSPTAITGVQWVARVRAGWAAWDRSPSWIASPGRGLRETSCCEDRLRSSARGPARREFRTLSSIITSAFAIRGWSGSRARATGCRHFRARRRCYRPLPAVEGRGPLSPKYGPEIAPSRQETAQDGPF